MAEPLVIGLIRDPLQWDRWDEARAMLEPVLDLSDETWGQVEADLSEGRASLGIVSRGGDPDLLAAMVLRTIYGKLGPITEVFLIAGRKYRDWVPDLSRLLAETSRKAGCVGLRAWGRPGWKHVLEEAGWNMPVVGYEMKLEAA